MIKYSVDSKRLDEYQRELKVFVDAVKSKDPDITEYNVFQGPDGLSFVHYVTFKDAAAEMKHSKSPHAKKLRRVMKKCVPIEPEYITLNAEGQATGIVPDIAEQERKQDADTTLHPQIRSKKSKPAPPPESREELEGIPTFAPAMEAEPTTVLARETPVPVRSSEPSSSPVEGPVASPYHEALPSRHDAVPSPLSTEAPQVERVKQRIRPQAQAKRIVIPIQPQKSSVRFESTNSTPKTTPTQQQAASSHVSPRIDTRAPQREIRVPTVSQQAPTPTEIQQLIHSDLTRIEKLLAHSQAAEASISGEKSSSTHAVQSNTQEVVRPVAQSDDQVTEMLSPQTEEVHERPGPQQKISSFETEPEQLYRGEANPFGSAVSNTAIPEEDLQESSSETSLYMPQHHVEQIEAEHQTLEEKQSEERLNRANLYVSQDEVDRMKLEPTTSSRD